MKNVKCYSFNNIIGILKKCLEFRKIEIPIYKYTKFGHDGLNIVNYYQKYFYCVL